MSTVSGIAQSLQRGANRIARAVERSRGARRSGGLKGMRAPRGTDAFNVEFVLQAAACIDWAALHPWMDAVDAKLGTVLPSTLYKLHVLASWFALDTAGLARACEGRAEFRRFIGAPLHGPLVETRLYMERAADFARARQALAKLVAAVELQLLERGFFPPAEVLTKLGTHHRLPAATPTQLLSTGLRRNRAPATSETAAAAAQGTASRPHGPSCQASPVLIWPWGTITPLGHAVAIGRDPAFSSYAEHLAADGKVSRRHAVLTPTDGGVLVQDLGSANGTYVDDGPVGHAGTTLVSADACLRFGPDLAVVLAFVPDTAEPAQP